ncbi:hypothetical protein GALL_191090 [mine drainage metagenome]|uniref:Uncharacterized protein n=1 Tax=mine drainage metagenome TaxID=410659 RepID=A0A1J5SAU6_9ZZZZ
MARPTCPRRIAHRAPSTYFKPAGIPLYELSEIDLAADELESLRLADEQGLYRVEAARKMGVSRQTFDRILRRARQSVARALVNGHALRIAHPAAPAPRRRTKKPVQ